MPRIPNISGPYRLFLYSFDCNEPKHVHVERDQATCKFRLDPLALPRNHGFAPHELTRIRALIAANMERISHAWNEHCGQA